MVLPKAPGGNTACIREPSAAGKQNKSTVQVRNNVI